MLWRLKKDRKRKIPLQSHVADTIGSLPEKPSDRDLELATHLAMAYAGKVLQNPSDDLRRSLWQSAFGPLYTHAPSYQHQDFEIADYQLHSLGIRKKLFRGPAPAVSDLISGNYICLLGAAQFFSRFQQEGLNDLISQQFRIPVLNLAGGGIGPEEYLRPEYAPYIRNAKLVIVQVLSGRSVGCDDYPGGMMTTYKGESITREGLLRIMLQEGRVDEYHRLLEQWSRNYVDLYRRLAESFPGRKMLVWMSERKPKDWSAEIGTEVGWFGKFPQLVTKETIEAIRPHFDTFVEAISGNRDLLKFTSRFTGEPCPFVLNNGDLKWESDYYPAPSAYPEAFKVMRPHIRKMLLS